MLIVEGECETRSQLHTRESYRWVIGCFFVLLGVGIGQWSKDSEVYLCPFRFTEQAPGFGQMCSGQTESSSWLGQ